MLCAPAIRFLCLLFLVPGLVSAEDNADTDLILILDASNSMWGQIDGVNKIVIAREAVGALVDHLPEQSNVGLIAYGHRRESDCDDIEVLRDIGTVDKPVLKATINAIKPKGKTPITGAINAAIDLARKRDSTAIVLISDGLETCSLDPCAAVRSAKQAGVPFILHVIGFDIANEDTAKLECAAQAGNGLYLSAQNAAQLAEALQAAYDKPTIPDGRLIVTTTAEGELQDAIVTVVERMSGEQVASGRTYSSSETNPRKIPLEDGKYKAEVRAIQIKGSPKFAFTFDIIGGNAVEKAFDYSAGDISITVTRNGELSDAVITVRTKDSGSSAASGRTYREARHNPMILRVAAGTYDVHIKSVEISNGPEPVFDDVFVTGNERTDLSYEYVSGNLSVATKRGATLVDAVVSVIDQTGKNVAGGRTYSSESSNPKLFTLAPGAYSIRIAEIRGDKRELAADVVAAATAVVVVDLDQP